MERKYGEPLLDHEADDESLDSYVVANPTSSNRHFHASLAANALLLVICVLLSVTLVFLSTSKHPQQDAPNDHIVEPYCK